MTAAAAWLARVRRAGRRVARALRAAWASTPRAARRTLALHMACAAGW